MLTTASEKLDGRYGRVMTVYEIDAGTLGRAKEIFAGYKERGVILNDDFDDSMWVVSNQTQTVKLQLAAFEAAYCKNAGWIGCDYPCYTDCVKAYIAFMLGQLGLSSLRELSNVLTGLADMTVENVLGIGEYANHVIEILQVIPGSNESRDYVIETLEEKAAWHNWGRRKGKRRILADFKTYLGFDDVMSDFWQIANEKEKLFYFPLYFWWTLTAILPLRPTELLLTPRNCLKQGGAGESILTIRRTKLKGGGEKIAYRIDEDYELKQYSIHKALADELRRYLDATAGARQTELGTLFLQAPHFKYIGKGRYGNNHYYTYGNLNTCLRYFYKEVVPLYCPALDSVRFGDTRHIAMASLILSGGSPVICRELAGHSDIDISSHYYANISNLVECVTLERYRKSKSGGMDIVGERKYPLSIPNGGYRLPAGWCDDESVATGEITECLKAAGEHGEIGDCTHCEHYQPDDHGIRMKFFDSSVGKGRVDADCQYLMQMIEQVRKGIGYAEDIGAALLRLQHSGSRYSKCLWEKYKKSDGDLWHGQEN